jgi:hypothetical protein
MSTGRGWSIGWRLKRLNVPLLLAGLGCLLAATVASEGLSFGGVSFGESPSEARALLALVGLGLLAASLWVGVERPPLALPVAPEDALEKWRDSLRRTVLDRRFRGEDSELHQMIRPGTVIDDLGAKERVDFRVDDQDRPRLRVRGRTVPWSELASEWDRAPGRMVVLGEPGCGKTVAALMLIGHTNAGGDACERVAELFKLVEWHRWRTQHAGERFADWLAYQLTESYEMPPDIARAIVESDLLLPVLDGLDELPARERRACKEAIDAYAGAARPFRPFVLTCRAREYAELAPDWVAADRQIALVGLDADQIVAVLEERTLQLKQWKRVRDEVATGNPHLIRLFRSPLRLMIALQAYRTRDPSELLEIDASAIEGRLWDLLLSRDGTTFDGARVEQIRAWLAFPAVAMNKEGRQRLWLHELYLFAPAAELSRFAVQLGLAVGLLFTLLIVLVVVLLEGLGAAPVAALAGAVLVGLPTGLAAWRRSLHAARAPSVRVTVPWRARIQVARRSRGLRLALAGALFFALGVALDRRLDSDGEADPAVADLLVASAVIFGFCGVLLGLFILTLDVLRAGTTVVAADPPSSLAAKGPTAVLTAARNNALVAGLVTALLGAMFGAVLETSARWLAALLGALFVGLFGALLVASFWLYHHWLRRRLAKQQLLPRRLHEFLDWCAEPQRGWLRVSDAYEFRHRELLDHLARGRGAGSVAIGGSEALGAPGGGQKVRWRPRGTRDGTAP